MFNNPIAKLFKKQETEGGSQIEQYGSIGMSRSTDVTRYILTTEDILEEIEMKLRGRLWSPSKERWVSKGQPILNEHGVNTIIWVVSTFLHRGIALSNYSDEDIKRICKGVRIQLIKTLMLEFYNFGVKRSNLSLVVRMVDVTIYSMMRRGYKAGERSELGQRYKHIEAPFPQQKTNIAHSTGQAYGDNI